MLNIEDITSPESYLLYGLAPTGGDDTSTILAEALANQYEVRLGPGTFNIVSNFRVNYPIKIIGAGRDKTFVNCVNPNASSIIVDSGSKLTQLDGSYFADMTLNGHVETMGFVEQRHILNINGVSNCTVERVNLIGFRGDGIYLGSGPDGGQERHNYNVKIRDCLFDGVNNNNRNAISIIDCDGLVIEDNEIKNCSRSDMPGAIDIEPNATWNALLNISILNNKISKCTGGVGCIAMFMSHSAYTPEPCDITVAFNKIDGNRTSNGIVFQYSSNALWRDLNITIFRNSVVETVQPLALIGVRGAKVCYNRFESSANACSIGYEANAKCVEVSLIGNTFKKLSDTNGQNGTGLLVYTADFLDVLYNRFEDCGRADGTGGIGIDFRVGSSNYVNLIGNIYRAPLGRMKNSIHNTGHTWNPTTNSSQGNNYNNIPWDFAFSGIEIPRFASSPSYKRGALYFDDVSGKLMVGGGSNWETVGSS